MKRLSNLGFKEKIKNLYNDDYILLTDYKNSSEKITLVHKKCNSKFEITSNEFTRSKNINKFKKYCPLCLPKKGRSKKDLQKELDLLSNKKILILEKNNQMAKKSFLKCKICNYRWFAPIHSLFSNLKKNLDIENNFGCPICSQKKKKTTKEYKKLVYDLTKNKYEILENYINTNTPIKTKCKTCNTIWKIRPVDFLYKENRCPNCKLIKSESKFNKIIKEILIENKICFKQEVKFKNCKNKRHLAFDFRILINNKKFLIEYDGMQHTRGWNGTKTSLEKYKLNDEIKNNFCKKNKIPLLRINYNVNTRKKVKIIISKFLKVKLK